MRGRGLPAHHGTLGNNLPPAMGVRGEGLEPEPEPEPEGAKQEQEPVPQAHAVQYSTEYVYRAEQLLSRSNRTFRKACRRMDAVLASDGLRMRVRMHAQPSPSVTASEGGC